MPVGFIHTNKDDFRPLDAAVCNALSRGSTPSLGRTFLPPCTFMLPTSWRLGGVGEVAISHAWLLALLFDVHGGGLQLGGGACFSFGVIFEGLFSGLFLLLSSRR